MNEEIKMTCQELITELKKIEENTRPFGASDTERLNEYGWARTMIGNTVFWEQVITLSGAAQTVELPLFTPLQLNRIEQEYNDATAKDIAITLQTPPTGYATILSTVAADINTSILLQLGIEYKYPPNTTLYFTWGNTTGGKTVKIRVTADVI